MALFVCELRSLNTSNSLEGNDGLLDLFEGFILGLRELGGANLIEAIHGDDDVGEGEAVHDAEALEEAGDTVEEHLLLVLWDEVEVDLRVNLLTEEFAVGGRSNGLFDQISLISRDLRKGGFEGHLDVTLLAFEDHRAVVNSAGGVQIEPFRKKLGDEFALGGIDGTLKSLKLIELGSKGVDDLGLDWKGGFFGLGLGRSFDGGGERGGVEFHDSLF